MEVQSEGFSRGRPNIQCICQIITVHGVQSRREQFSAFVKSLNSSGSSEGEQAEYTVHLSNHNSSWKFSQKGAEAEYTVQLSNHNSSWKFSQKGAEAEYTVHLSNHNSSWKFSQKGQRPNIQCICQIKQFMEVQQSNHSWKFSQKGAEAEYTVHLSNHNSSWKFSQKEQRPNIQCICQIITVHGSSVRRAEAEYTVHLSNHNSSWKFSQKGRGRIYSAFVKS
ncbi:MMP14 [Acanthosepion pharaonis]|uniref:MMP14 n=1 Tax=Acanthosepion pharaonis TaxID=158019 RepID=A0A812EH70_ACAPH|nr:MMP14 [Sepia pharaonis]